MPAQGFLYQAKRIDRIGGILSIQVTKALISARLVSVQLTGREVAVALGHDYPGGR